LTIVQIMNQHRQGIDYAAAMVNAGASQWNLIWEPL
jgi:hypothetical protein